jgi:hypothetical protein
MPSVLSWGSNPHLKTSFFLLSSSFFLHSIGQILKRIHQRWVTNLIYVIFNRVSFSTLYTGTPVCGGWLIKGSSLIPLLSRLKFTNCCKSQYKPIYRLLILLGFLIHILNCCDFNFYLLFSATHCSFFNNANRCCF